MDKILIVDDDQRLLKMLGADVDLRRLRRRHRRPTAKSALTRVYEDHPDVIVLDWMLPRLDGVAVLETCARKAKRNADPDADRTRCRPGSRGGAGTRRGRLSREALRLHRTGRAGARTAAARGKGQQRAAHLCRSHTRLSHRARYGAASAPFTLTPTEFDLLNLFMRHPRQVLERRQILTQVWGYDFVGDDNVLEVYVGYLRKKTEAEGESRLIQTVRGIGYVLREES